MLRDDLNPFRTPPTLAGSSAPALVALVLIIGIATGLANLLGAAAELGWP